MYLVEKNTNNDFKDTKKILIIGGSQGSKFFDENITEIILNVSKKLNIQIYQQVYNDSKKNLIKKKYDSFKIKNKLFDFDENLFDNLSDFDLAITRSGASAISELSHLNIPFIAIPFPFARDNHQYYNAKFYKNRDCCWLFAQSEIDENILSDKIIHIFTEKDEYFKKKEKLEKISNQNTWNIVNKKLLQLINEN